MRYDVLQVGQQEKRLCLIQTRGRLILLVSFEALQVPQGNFFSSMRTEVFRVVGRECGRLGLAGLSKKEAESDSASRMTICV